MQSTSPHPPDEIIVEGTLVQQSTEEPLPYATVAVYSSADSTMVTNALTEDDGAWC